jgi:hypothetical protein
MTKPCRTIAGILRIVARAFATMRRRPGDPAQIDVGIDHEIVVRVLLLVYLVEAPE